MQARSSVEIVDTWNHFEIVHCSINQFYDGVASKCVDCADICRLDPGYTVYCQNNCPEFYEKLLSENVNIPGVLHASTSAGNQFGETSSVSGYINPYLMIGIFMGVTVASVVIVVAVIVMLRHLRRAKKGSPADKGDGQEKSTLLNEGPSANQSPCSSLESQICASDIERGEPCNNPSLKKENKIQEPPFINNKWASETSPQNNHDEVTDTDLKNNILGRII